MNRRRTKRKLRSRLFAARSPTLRVPTRSLRFFMATMLAKTFSHTARLNELAAIALGPSHQRGGRRQPSMQPEARAVGEACVTLAIALEQFKVSFGLLAGERSGAQLIEGGAGFGELGA